MFKQGQKVKIVKKVKDNVNGWATSMDNHVGDIGIIKTVESDGIEVKFENDDYAWWFNQESLSLVEKDVQSENNPHKGMHWSEYNQRWVWC